VVAATSRSLFSAANAVSQRAAALEANDTLAPCQPHLLPLEDY